jgi:hypothetical protein
MWRKWNPAQETDAEINAEAKHNLVLKQSCAALKKLTCQREEKTKRVPPSLVEEGDHTHTSCDVGPQPTLYWGNTVT